MNKEEVINQFKKAHPELMKLNPIIMLHFIEEESDSEGKHIIHDPPTPQFTVKHPFIFDKRLIPKVFNGIEVIGFEEGLENPKEFPSPNAALPLEDYWAPENYVKFVDNNLSLIAKKLKNPDISREEAFDALTGDFKKHIDYCVNLRMTRIDDETENIAFFNKLLYKLKQAYFLSDAYKIHGDKGWSYALTSTSFNKEKPLILGFNWGASKKLIEAGNKYTPQTEYPFRHFESLYDELGSFKQVADRFHDYYPSALYGNQTNYCFFRSEKENQISPRDLELCVPIFNELLEYINPTSIITFSNQLHKYFSQNKKIDFQTEAVKSGNRNVYVSKGKITLGSKPIDYFHLPHPSSYRYHKPEVIEKAWEFCFGKANP